MNQVCHVCGLTADESGGLKPIQMYDQNAKVTTVYVCTTGPCEHCLTKKPEVDLREGRGLDQLPGYLQPGQ